MTPMLLVKLGRDLRATWVRIVLMVIAIAISLIAFSMVLYARVIAEPQIIAAYLSTNPSSARIAIAGGVNPDQLEVLREAALQEPTVIDATLRRSMTFQLLQEGGRLSATPLQLFIAPPDDPMRIAIFPVTEGSWPPPPDGMLMELQALTYLGVEVGDSVTVAGFDGQPVSLRITGVVHDPSLAPAYEEGKGYGFVSTAALPRLGVEPVLDELVLSVADAPGDTTPGRDRTGIVAAALRLADSLARERGLEIGQIAVPPPYQHPHQGQMNGMLLAMLTFGALSLLLAAILIASMINALLSQQVPQIGILKAIGARASRILQLYLVMTFVVVGAATVLAFVPGIALGRGWAEMVLFGMLNVEPTNVQIPWTAYAIVIGTGLGLPLLVALGPVVGASRTTVREAIGAAGTERGVRPASSFDSWLSGIRGLDRMLLMGFRNIFRRRARLVLSVGLLATAGAIFVAGLNAFAGALSVPQGLMLDRRWDVELSLAAPESAMRSTEIARRVPGVERVETWNTSSTGLLVGGRITVTSTYPDQGHGAMGVTAVPPTSTLFTPPPVRDGRWLRPDDSNAVVINQGLAKARPDLGVGATIQMPLGGRLTEWTVVGVAEELFAPMCPCVPSAGFEQATGRAGEANVLRITTDRHDPGSRIAIGEEIGKALAAEGIRVQAVRPIDWMVAVSEGHVYVLLAVFLLISLVMGVVGLIGLGSTMSANVIERTREFGVMSAIGARAGVVRRLVITEGIFIALASFVVAAIPALLLTQVFAAGVGNLMINAPLPYRISAPAIGIWVVAIVVGAALATLAPAVRASRLTVREALAYV